MRPATGLLLAGLAAVALGVALLVRDVAGYLAHPLAASSTSGVRVFRLPDGTLGGFEPYAIGYEPVVIGVGLMLVVAAALVGAALRDREVRPSALAAPPMY